VAVDNETLWDQVHAVMTPRAGWSLEPQSSPGSPHLWCLPHDEGYELTVGVEGHAVSIYLVEQDLELLLPDTASLKEWLDTNESLFRQRDTMTKDMFESLLLDRAVQWRRLGY
jgi:hypothetical protein